MKTFKHSKRYANMFLNAVGVEDAPEAMEELALVYALMQKSAEFRRLLSGPMFSQDERDGALAEVGGMLDLSEHSLKFVRYLAEEGAAWALGDVINKAVAIYSDRKKRVNALVITANSVGPEYEDRLKKALKRITRKDVTIEYRKDPALLGGMLVKVGSTMFDGSIKGQLRLLKEDLVKG
jgi:ATP synthase F1 delta subunit